MGWCPRSVVADGGIFAERHTRTNDLVKVRRDCRPEDLVPYLLRHILEVLLDQVVACRVVQGEEAPWVAKRDQMRFSWKELDVQHLEQRDLLARDRSLVYPIPQRGFQHCAPMSTLAPLPDDNGCTYMMSKSRTSFDTFSSGDRP